MTNHDADHPFHQVRRRDRAIEVVITLLVGIAWALSACGAGSQPVADSSQLVVTGVVRPATEARGADRLVVVFLDAREVGRSAARCEPSGCPFRIVVPNTYGLTGQGREPGGAVRMDVGVIGEEESRTFDAPALPTERGRSRHVYAAYALAGPVEQLPPEFLSGRLGMLPGPSVIVITSARPDSQAQDQSGLLKIVIVAGTLLAFLACLTTTAGVAGGAVLIIWARQRRPVG